MALAGMPISRRKALGGTASLATALCRSASVLAKPMDVVSSVVGVRANVPDGARTAAELGRVRTGTGTLLDNGGLVLTLGRLIVEADHVEVLPPGGASVPAGIVAYDDWTGLGLVRTTTPLALPPAALGKSGAVEPDERLLAISVGAPIAYTEVQIVDRRPFAASWEFALDQALFTAPQHADLAGAALVDRKGMLIGVGAMAIAAQPATGEKGSLPPTDLFIPIDALKAALGDLLAMGHRDAPARPWLGAACPCQPRRGGGHIRRRRRPRRARRLDARGRHCGRRREGHSQPVGALARRLVGRQRRRGRDAPHSQGRHALRRSRSSRSTVAAG